MRPYSPDSPQATSRLLALALLADGGLDARELRLLEKDELLARLGVVPEGFEQVLHEFCDDLLVSALRTPAGHLELDPATLEALLGEVQSPAQRRKLLRAMLDIVHADGLLAGGEALLLSVALRTWEIDLHEVADTSVARRGAVAALPA